MKRNKLLDKLVDAAVRESFIKGKLDTVKVKTLASSFKKLPTSQAIYSLTRLMKRLRMEMDKYTLSIESATDVSKQSKDKVEKVFRKQYTINQTQSIKTPSLLGGLRVKIGDNLYDYSVKEKINQVRGVIENG